MIISDLNYMEVASESASIQGGNSIKFDTTNKFRSRAVTDNDIKGYNASGGAKGVVTIYGDKAPKATFTKADSTSYVNDYGDSKSTSTSAAVIEPK